VTGWDKALQIFLLFFSEVQKKYYILNFWPGIIQLWVSTQCERTCRPGAHLGEVRMRHIVELRQHRTESRMKEGLGCMKYIQLEIASRGHVNWDLSGHGLTATAIDEGKRQTNCGAEKCKRHQFILW
jgi:hypothetical protein